MSDFKTRLIEERDQLEEKQNKLLSFIHSDNFANIDPKQKSLLKVQAQAMGTYLVCLIERIEALG